MDGISVLILICLAIVIVIIYFIGSTLNKVLNFLIIPIKWILIIVSIVLPIVVCIVIPTENPKIGRKIMSVIERIIYVISCILICFMSSTLILCLFVEASLCLEHEHALVVIFEVLGSITVAPLLQILLIGATILLIYLNLIFAEIGTAGIDLMGESHSILGVLIFVVMIAVEIAITVAYVFLLHGWLLGSYADFIPMIFRLNIVRNFLSSPWTLGFLS